MSPEDDVAAARGARPPTTVRAASPDRLVHSLLAVLPVSAVAVGVHTDLLGQLPLAATSAEAELAEQLQFTAGEGPGRTVHGTGRPVSSDAADLTGRWPVFADLLLTQTDFTAVVALPLRAGGVAFGVLELLLHSGSGLRDLDAGSVVRLAGLAAGLLVGGGRPDLLLEEVTRCPASTAARRTRVWQANGMLASTGCTDLGAALLALRGYAYGQGRTVDDVSADLVDRQLDPRTVLAGSA